jgi:hypothetical protein
VIDFYSLLSSRWSHIGHSHITCVVGRGDMNPVLQSRWREGQPVDLILTL